MQMPKELGDLKKLKSITFDGCENLEGTVFLPPGVSLEPYAFRGCAKLDLGSTLKRYIIDNPDLEELDLSGYEHLKEVSQRQRLILLEVEQELVTSSCSNPLIIFLSFADAQGARRSEKAEEHYL